MAMRRSHFSLACESQKNLAECSVSINGGSGCGIYTINKDEGIFGRVNGRQDFFYRPVGVMVKFPMTK